MVLARKTLRIARGVVVIAIKGGVGRDSGLVVAAFLQHLLELLYFILAKLHHVQLSKPLLSTFFTALFAVSFSELIRFCFECFVIAVAAE